MVTTSSSIQEIRAEAQHCEQRGWCVALEDEYAEVEASVFREEGIGHCDMVPIPEKTLPPVQVDTKRRTFRLLHLFSGFRRMWDVEWWVASLSTTMGIFVEV